MLPTLVIVRGAWPSLPTRASCIPLHLSHPLIRERASTTSIDAATARVALPYTRGMKRKASAPRRQAAKTIDEYIERCAPQAQPILRRVRATIAKAAPDATETISYGIPAFKLRRILVYFAAFKHHVGLYPPVKGDAALEKAVAPYANEKGNLRFPLDQKIPYALIARIVKFKATRSR